MNAILLSHTTANQETTYGPSRNSRRLIGYVSLSTALLVTGCQTPAGQQNNTGTGTAIGTVGGAVAGAIIGNQFGHNALVGALIGGLIGGLAGHSIGSRLDAQQLAYLQKNSPETLAKIQHNDAVLSNSSGSMANSASGQQQAASTQVPASASSASGSNDQASSGAVDPMSANDVKMMVGAGVKDDDVVDAITRGKSKFTQQDVADLQQAGVSGKVLDTVKQNVAS